MTSVMRGTKKSPGLVCDYILSIIRNGLDEHNLIETMHNIIPPLRANFDSKLHEGLSTAWGI
jgi:hypothetical protein